MTPNLHANESTGQKMVESGWLDLHYQASREQYEQLLLAAGLREGWRVLDAGAGSGSYLPLLGRIVGERGSIHAVDLAGENVRAMRERLDTMGLGCPVEVIQGSVLELPFEDGSFDAVWCANTIQYFPAAKLGELFDEFRRVLKPGGLLAVKEFDNVGLHFGPFDPVLRWHLLEALKDSELLLGAGALVTADLKSHLIEAGFREVRFESFVGDFQHPLTPVQREFLASALELYSSLAEQVELPEGEIEQWRAKVGNPKGEEYLLHRPEFYFRELHGLATGVAPG